VRWLVLCAIALGGCSFDPAGLSSANAGGDDAGPPDGAPGTCAPGGTICNGRFLDTCDGDGEVIPDQRVTCPLSCEEDHCTAASNIAVADQLTCEPGAPALVADAGAIIVVNGAGDGTIDCSSCGGAPLSIPATGVVEQGDTDLAWFCLSAIDLPPGVSLTVSPAVTTSLAFFVDGEVTIDGDIDASGGAAIAIAAGVGGPGGGTGGPASAVEGIAGSGPCAGDGGSRAGTIGDHGSGGGGGGGHFGAGGDGGDGNNPSNDATAAGGAGGASGCGAEDLVPLVGGSGGGSGSDGSCGECSWPGGGGGGAIQIASRMRIAIGGSVSASGGAGFGSVDGFNGRGGAGGGGAGGAILLEAPLLALTGQLRVDGGHGGVSGAGNGAAGASAGTMDGRNAPDADAAGEGGPGGGGGGGRIRLDTPTTVVCSEVATPRNSCTAGDLLVPASAR
jgi:hypothetical protein